MQYLVEKYAKNDSLYPKDLWTRAKINQFLQFDNEYLFVTLGTISVKLFFYNHNFLLLYIVNKINFSK